MINYQFIKGSRTKGFIIGGSRSLWLADDHLLLVQNNIYNENYKRFYFKDIQACFISNSTRQTWLHTIAGLILLFFVLIGVTTDEPVLSNTFYTLTIAPLIIIFINWFKGKSCTCYIQTKVQNIQLPMNRRKKAERILAQLSEKIIRSQKSETAQ